jgi:hypothetical protein
MKRILRASAIAPCIAAAVWMTSLAPNAHNLASAQQLMPGQTVIYYNGYGQGYYGVYVPSYRATYTVVPYNGYSGYGNGPYGNDPGYVNQGSYGPFGNRAFGASAYRAARAYNYYYGY